MKPTKHHEPSRVKRCIMPSSISVRAGSSHSPFVHVR